MKKMQKLKIPSVRHNSDMVRLRPNYNTDGYEIWYKNEQFEIFFFKLKNAPRYFSLVVIEQRVFFSLTAQRFDRSFSNFHHVFFI